VRAHAARYDGALSRDRYVSPQTRSGRTDSRRSRGVGLLLVQIAKIARSARDRNGRDRRESGVGPRGRADDVVVYAEHDFAEVTRELVGAHGVDVAYDSVGKDTWERSLAVLKPRGMLVIFGGASGPVPPINVSALAAGGSLYLTRPTLGDFTRTRDEVLGRARDLFAMVREGKLEARIGAAYPLASAAEAQRDLEARATTGKLLLVPSGFGFAESTYREIEGAGTPGRSQRRGSARRSW